MGLVHDAKDNLAVTLVVSGQLRPEADELVIGWTALSDNATVPAGVVVDINNTISAQRETTLNQLVILAKIVRVERTAKVVVDNELPSSRQAENVEGIRVDEV